MEGSYKTFLEMKTLFSEFPSSFYSKLSNSELDKFKQLIQAAESLKPSPPPKRPRRSLSIDPIYFQPKNIIFCLNIKKLFTKKKFAFIRYSFALIRCLFKEFQRIEARKRKYLMTLNKEPFSKDIGIDAERLESELTERAEYTDSKTFQALEKIFKSNKNYRKKQRILACWKREFEASRLRKRGFLRKIKNVVKGLARRVMGSVNRFGNWKVLAGNILVRTLVPVIRGRKNKVFLQVFFRGRFMNPCLTVKTQETVNEFNIGKRIDKIKRVIDTVSKENEAPEIENFKYLERKNTIMTKKKKVLLRSAPNKIEKLEKNHRWALAFALLKWKKQYFSIKSEGQSRQNAVCLASELLTIFTTKYQKRLSSILFENLKVKYLISIQNKNFKTYLLFKMISGIISSKQNIILYRAFRAISASHYKKVSFPNLSIDMKNLHEHESRGELLYKILKKVHSNSQLKKKVCTFIAIQNFEPKGKQYTLRYGLKCLYNSLERCVFFKKYVTFFEIKEKTFIIQKKCEFLTYSIQTALDKAFSRNLKFSVLSLKLQSLDQIHLLMLDISKVQRKKLIRSAFNGIKEYANDMGEFIYARNLFAGSLMSKIYFKRVSSSML